MSAGKGDGSWTPSDYRGGSGDVRDSYRLPDGDVSRARYAKEVSDEAGGKQPSIMERFRRWFSARF